MHVVTIHPEASVREAARLMTREHVKDLVVVRVEDGAERPIGVLVDHDVVTSVVAAGASVDEVPVERVMRTLRRGPLAPTRQRGPFDAASDYWQGTDPAAVALFL